MSAFTPNLNLEEPAAGQYPNSWAPVVNENWTVIDTAMGGYSTINVTSVAAGNYALTTTNYVPPNLYFTGTLTANLGYYLPYQTGRIMSIYNQTSGAFTITLFNNAVGRQIVLPQGRRTLIISDGTNVDLAQTAGALSANPTALVGLTPVNGIATTFMTSDSAPVLNTAISPSWTGTHTFSGNVGLNGYVQLNGTMDLGGPLDATAVAGGSVKVPTQSPGNNTNYAASTAFVAALGALLAPLASPALTGVPTVPTATTGTNTTQAASTAFVQTALTATTAGSSTNGSIKLGNFLINYGSGLVCFGSSPNTVNYTTAFTSFVAQVVVLPYGTGENQILTVHSGYQSSLSSFTFDFFSTSNTVQWFAFGI
jgi:hypothetical protein